ncbi:tRNA 2-thiocytidine(32) synthetase TtcA, partial [Pseudomonas aeruginosa]
RSLFDFIDLSIDRSDVRPPYEFEAAEVSSSSVEGRIDVVRIL